MTQYFSIHPDNPQMRLIHQAVNILQNNGVIVYPTDSGYAFGCQIGNKCGMETIRRLRNLDDKHNFTLVCHDFSQISEYAKMDTASFRRIKSVTPGAYTFILQATKNVPRRLIQSKRKTIGIRLPDNKIAQALLKDHGEPILSTTAMLAGESVPHNNPENINNILGGCVDLVIDGGYGEVLPTTIVDMVNGTAEVVRKGQGDPNVFK